MAIIGGSLTAPENGWQRTDVLTTSAIKFDTGWTSITAASAYGGSTMYSNSTVGSKARFKFNGTQIRIIAPYNSASEEVKISIDGVIEKYNPYAVTQVYQYLVYEKMGLSSGVHEVEIWSDGLGRVYIDAIDLNSGGYLIASVGDVLATPETGWKRYEETSSCLMFKGAWTVSTGVGYSGGAEKYATSFTALSSVEFDFVGTGIRLVSYRGTDRHSSVNITIDGIPYVYSCNGVAQTFTLNFEKTGLSNQRHKVVISAAFQNNNLLEVDAIDIDTTGRLYHPDEVTDIKDLAVGKRIRCHYVASSNVVGSFSGLGVETSDLIPASSSATPNGDFYWIMFEDVNKKKVLVADRNVQSAISWDVLNTAGIASGSGVPATTIMKIINKTPYLTSATSSTYTVTSIGTALTGEEVWRAFGVGFWGSYAGTGLILDCISPIKYGQVKITCYYAANMANVIDVYGSNDNVNFSLIKTCQKSSWIDGEASTFVFDTPVTYRYYKVMKTSQVSGSNPARMNIEFSYSEELSGSNNYKFTLRLPIGGVSTTDKDNEWDKYIVNSSLNGMITAGDNAVWNWNGLYTWTSTTVSTSGNTYRMLRGYSSSNGTGALITSRTDASNGFRPVLLIETITSVRSLIKFDGVYKKWVEGTPATFLFSDTIPKMTSDNAPDGIASASSVVSTNYAWKAFDKLNTASDKWASQNASFPQWLAFEISTPKVVSGYSLSCNDVANRHPKDWKFEALINGSWTTIDFRSETGWYAYEKRTYYLSSSVSASKFRIWITSNNGATDYVQIGELEILEKIESSPAIPAHWQTISTTFPSVDTFKSDGMSDLSILDRKPTTFSSVMSDNGSTGSVLGSGKVFKKSVDLKKLFEITDMKIQ